MRTRSLVSFVARVVNMRFLLYISISFPLELAIPDPDDYVAEEEEVKSRYKRL